VGLDNVSVSVKIEDLDSISISYKYYSM